MNLVSGTKLDKLWHQESLLHTRSLKTKQFHLRMSFMKQNKKLVYLISTLEHTSLLWQIRHFCCLPMFSGCLKESICALVWVASWTSCLYSRNYFCFYLREQFEDKLWLFRLGHMAKIFSKNVIMLLSFQECNWQYLLLMINMWAFNQKLEFWETYICYHELDGFSIPKDFSEEFGSNIIEFGFWILYNELCQHFRSLHNFLNNFLNNQCMMF